MKHIYYLLGIQSYANHDSGASILKYDIRENVTDYVAISEERLLRKKYPYNKELQINLSKISGENSQLYNEIKEFKSELKNKDLYLESINQKNRSFEINNAELKNTISRFIENNKKLQEKLNVLEQSNQTDIKEKNNKIKFYQDENVRLSSELLSAQKSTENIRLNLSDIAMEKQMISNKIKELNKSIEEKTNVISTKFNKEKPDINQENLENLNDIEQKSLDEVVKRIFQKL